MYVLDTDHCVELLRDNPKIVFKFKSLHKDTVLYTTIITIAELLYGAYRLPNPLFIASIVSSRGLVLVTHNSQHYKRISGLRLEDWVK